MPILSHNPFRHTREANPLTRPHVWVTHHTSQSKCTPHTTCHRPEVEALGKGDRLDLITRLAKRFELQRIKVHYRGALLCLLL